MSVRPLNFGLTPTEEPSTYCLADGCRNSAHAEAPVSLCGRHIHEVYTFAQDLVGARWSETLNDELARSQPQPVQLPKADPPSWVYFARVGDLIKIGFSTYPKARFKTLKVDEVLAVIPGTRDDERRCHTAFAHLRAHGEYFRPGEDLLAFIAAA
jgi:hypothetical protein